MDLYCLEMGLYAELEEIDYKFLDEIKEEFKLICKENKLLGLDQ